MPAKKVDRRGGSLPNKLRWGTMSQGDLELKASMLEKHAATLRAAKDSMSDLDVDDIKLDSVTKFDRANELLMTYMAKVEMAVIAAKYGQ